MATEYISREAVLAKAYWHGDSCIQSNPYPDGVEAVDVSAIEQIPTADVRPVVRARWKWIAESACHVCSNCGAVMRYNPEKGFFIFHTLPNFCHNCGADMREISDSDNKVSCEFD